MNRIKRHITLIGLSIFISTEAFCDNAEMIKEIETKLNGVKVEIVTPSIINGLYQVYLNNGRVIHTTEDVSNFIVGNSYTVTPDNGIVNKTDEIKNKINLKNISGLEGSAITFKAENEKAKVFVFTDVDCGYCRMLHSSLDEYLAKGISISYFAYPRAGINSSTFTAMQSAWCSDNPQDALTKIKNGENIPSKSCSIPLYKHYNLGKTLGVTGTPAIILPSGERVDGYLNPFKLALKLNLPVTNDPVYLNSHENEGAAK